jgi:hypothetical protein
MNDQLDPTLVLSNSTDAVMLGRRWRRVPTPHSGVEASVAEFLDATGIWGEPFHEIRAGVMDSTKAAELSTLRHRPVADCKELPSFDESYPSEQLRATVTAVPRNGIIHDEQFKTSNAVPTTCQL